MSVATASMCNNNTLMSGPQGKGSLSSPTIDYVASKKRRDDSYQNSKSNPLEGDFSSSSLPQQNGGGEKDLINKSTLHSTPHHTSNNNHHPHLNSEAASNPYNSLTNGVAEGGHNFPPTYTPTPGGVNNNNNNNNNNGSVDSAGPLPNEIFELLNEFWRPNEMVADTQLLGNNGKFSRRSPEGSTDETAEEEKDGDDDITSLADTDIGVDRTTQKRRYSRLSDGYERLKSVLPTVKDKRRVSKARILDEAINYIQRLESITSVLKREHEKRLSMLNGTNGFFPDYSVQPYMRSIFQKQVYPSSSNGKMSNYSKLNSPTSSVSKSPRMKQYNQQSYSSQSPMSVNAGPMSGGPIDYSYNNIGGYSVSSMYTQNNSTDPTQMLNGTTGTGTCDSASPINNTSPYSACSLSPGGSTPTTYQNGGSSSVVNNTWPYQGAALNYNDTSTYNQNRQSPNNTYNTSNPYSSLNSSMWGSMTSNGGTSDSSSQIGQHTGTGAEHTMKV